MQTSLLMQNRLGVVIRVCAARRPVFRTCARPVIAAAAAAAGPAEAPVASAPGATDRKPLPQNLIRVGATSAAKKVVAERLRQKIEPMMLSAVGDAAIHNMVKILAVVDRELGEAEVETLVQPKARRVAPRTGKPQQQEQQEGKQAGSQPEGLLQATMFLYRRPKGAEVPNDPKLTMRVSRTSTPQAVSRAIIARVRGADAKAFAIEAAGAGPCARLIDALGRARFGLRKPSTERDGIPSQPACDLAFSVIWVSSELPSDAKGPRSVLRFVVRVTELGELGPAGDGVKEA